MIVNNAGSRRDVDFWTTHLASAYENERAELRQIRGLSADNLAAALLEMQRAAAVLPRLKNFMYHADFNPCQHERLTGKDWERAFEIFENRRGISQGTPRIVYEHENHGRIHRHVIWSRVDLANMRAFPDGLDAKTAHAAAREIERELGLAKVVGPFDREPGTPRPKRAPKPWEMYRGLKTGIDPRDIAAKVTELRQQSRNGKEFQAALEQHGYELVTGRRGFLILDHAGKEHSLAKRASITTAELNAFMRDVDRAALPTVEQARAKFQERKIAGPDSDRATMRDEIHQAEASTAAKLETEKIDGRFIAPEDREKETSAFAEATADTPATGHEPAMTGRQGRSWPINPPMPEPKPPGFFEQVATARQPGEIENQNFPQHDRKAPGIIQTIRQLFRDVKKALTCKAPVPQPPRPRRRRGEETRGAFKLALQKIMRRIRRPEIPPPEPERLWLSDTMDWLQLWHEEPIGEPDVCDEPTRPDAFDSSADFSPDL